jgi:hypothetical protein
MEHATGLNANVPQQHFSSGVAIFHPVLNQRNCIHASQNDRRTHNVNDSFYAVEQSVQCEQVGEISVKAYLLLIRFEEREIKLSQELSSFQDWEMQSGLLQGAGCFQVEDAIGVGGLGSV